MAKLQVKVEDRNGVVRSLDYDHALNVLELKTPDGQSKFTVSDENWVYINGNLSRTERKAISTSKSK